MTVCSQNHYVLHSGARRTAESCYRVRLRCSDLGPVTQKPAVFPGTPETGSPDVQD